MGRRTLAIAGLLAAALCAGVAQAADAPEPTPRLLPDPRLSLGEAPGEISLRVPLSSPGASLYGLLSPYLTLGSPASLGVPWSTTPDPGLRRDPEAPEELRLGAGLAMPVSGRVQLYGEYRFLRGRLDASVGRLQRDPDGADFRAGFSIRLD